MKKFIEITKKNSVDLLKDRQFWRIQGLSVQYLVKYYAWYSVLVTIFVYSLVALNYFSTPILSGVSNLSLAGVLLQLVFTIQGVSLMVKSVSLAINQTRRTFATFVKTFLLLLVMTGSGYFSPEFYKGIQQFSDIPVSVGYQCFFWGILYFLMNYSIKKFWRRIGNDLILKPETYTASGPVEPSYFSQRIAYKEPLEKFVVPLAITKEMKLINGRWAFVDRNNEIVEEEDFVMETNLVTVQLRYSLLPPQDLIYGKN
uniref:hypothetical protein n=1 Tax=Enterococcus faecalis TaxID=1351 RepID=UPI0003F901D4|nr:hypothetical protein [Enterococcus faecalis]